MNMIYEFTFENYRSYRHEATIDFTAKPINEFEQSLINGSNGQKLLFAQFMDQTAAEKVV